MLKTIVIIGASGDVGRTTEVELAEAGDSIYAAIQDIHHGQKPFLGLCPSGTGGNQERTSSPRGSRSSVEISRESRVSIEPRDLFGGSNAPQDRLDVSSLIVECAAAFVPPPQGTAARHSSARVIAPPSGPAPTSCRRRDDRPRPALCLEISRNSPQ